MADDKTARTAVISNLAWPTWNQTSEAHGIGYGKAVALTDALIAEALSPVMQIVLAYVIESNDNGGIDCNDLVGRLEDAGYPLPDEDDD